MNREHAVRATGERRGSRAALAVTAVLALVAVPGALALRAMGTTTDPPASLLVQPFVEPVPLPAVALSDLDGRALGAAQLRGQTVLLNFWATRCVPCRAEMPALSRFTAHTASVDSWCSR